MEAKKTNEQLPYWTKRDFFIKKKQKEIWDILEIRTERWTVYESLKYPHIDIKEISERKNNSLLISAEIINSNEKWKYLEINGEKFYELNKWWNRKIGNYFYIDKSKNRNWVFHIGKITGFEEWYNKQYAIRRGQSMRKDWSTHTWRALIDVE